ncbi:MAG: hypothetical protein QNJ53_21120 [Pleurocapsa sp. MO_192.B19]|nr:hypothetical protein [Pleurocapsa sp. MO_192.B19]
MNLDYPQIKQKLETVKEEINDLISYIEANQSKPDRRKVDLEIYTRLANISTHVVQSDCAERTCGSNRQSLVTEGD